MSTAAVSPGRRSPRRHSSGTELSGSGQTPWLVITESAVEKHVGAIFQKLALEDDEVVSRRVTAVLLYLSDSTR